MSDVGRRVWRDVCEAVRLLEQHGLHIREASFCPRVFDAGVEWDNVVPQADGGFLVDDLVRAWRLVRR